MNIDVQFQDENKTFDPQFEETHTIEGKNGATFIPSVSPDGVISWTNDKDLPNPEPVNIKGVKGDKGDKGDRGLQGVQGIQGEKGEPGAAGRDGVDGYTPIKGVDYFDGINGKDGYTPQKGIDYFDGKDGYTPVKGVDYFDGKDGKDGMDGHTPVKGEDYFTEAEKTELVNEVIASVSNGVYGTTPIFETTTSEAVSYMKVDTKTDGTKFRLKSALVLIEAAEDGTDTVYCHARFNNELIKNANLTKSKANAVAYAEFYISRGRWRGVWRPFVTNTAEAANYQTAYRDILQTEVAYPVIDLIGLYALPANTKVMVYGVEENA